MNNNRTGNTRGRGRPKKRQFQHEKAAPKINVPPRFQSVSAYEKGEDVVIKIPFTGNPKPSVKWLRDNTAVSGHRYNIDVIKRHALLTIKSATKEDSGPWRLTLENDLGSDSAIIKIQINGMTTDENHLKIGAVFSLASLENDETDVTFESAWPKEGVALVTYNDDSNASNGETPTAGVDMTSPLNEMTSYVNDMTSSKMSAIADEALHDSHPHIFESLLSAEAYTFTTGKNNDKSMSSLSLIKQKPLSLPTHSIKENIAAVIENDSPPRLPKEYSVRKLMGDDLMGNKDSITPPVLRPEVPSLTKTKVSSTRDYVSIPLPVKKRKIDPSYIVLTSIDPWLGTRSSVTLSDFAHAQTECSIMCKKTSFTHRLARGDDVFNVKTPSKQKDYQVYLEKYEKAQEVDASKKPGVGMSIKDLLDRQDNRILRGVNGPAKRYLNRVRRTIIRVPADFKTSVAMGELEQSEIQKNIKTVLENQEKELWEERREREQICELETLGKMIEIKRSWNRKLKRLKLADEIAADMLAKIKTASEVSRRELELVEDRHRKALENSFLEVTQKHKKQKVDIVNKKQVNVEKATAVGMYGKTGAALNRIRLMADIENEICTKRAAMRNGKSLSNSYTRSLLTTKSFSPDLSQVKSVPLDSHDVDKEPMMFSDLMTSEEHVKTEPMDNGYEQANNALIEEKFKKFKVPDKVKQLFINKSQSHILTGNSASAKPLVSNAATHNITNMLRNSQQIQPPSQPVSVILPKQNIRPQVMVIPVTIPTPVRAQFQVTTQPLVPASVRGQCEAIVIHQALTTSKLENQLMPQMPQKVTVGYSAHDPSKPPVQAVGSMQPTTLLTTNAEQKKVSSMLPTTLNDADDKKPNSNAKFYLLKVDGKNILIPLATDHSTPMAYVMNGTSLLKTTAPTAMTSTISSSARNVSTVSVAPRTAPSVGGKNASAVKTTCTQIAPTVNTTKLSTAASASIFSAKSTTVPSVGANNTLVVQSTETLGVVNSQGMSKTMLTEKAQTLKTQNSDIGNNASVLQTTLTQVAHTINTKNLASRTQTDASVRAAQSYNNVTQTVGEVTSLANKSTQPLAKVTAFLRPTQSEVMLQLQTLKTSKNEGNKSEPPKHDLAKSDARNSPTDVKETQLQTLKTKLVNMKSKYDGSEKTTIRNFLKDFRGETSAKETICNSSLTNTSSAEHSAKNTTHPSEPTKPNLVTSDFTTSSVDVKESKPFFEGITPREERLRKLKELLKEKQRAVDEIWQKKADEDRSYNEYPDYVPKTDVSESDDDADYVPKTDVLESDDVPKTDVSESDDDADDVPKTDVSESDDDADTSDTFPLLKGNNKADDEDRRYDEDPDYVPETDVSESDDDADDVPETDVSESDDDADDAEDIFPLLKGINKADHMLQNDIHIEEGSDNDEDDNTRSHAEPQLKFGPRNGCKKRYDKINVCTFCGKQNKSKITRHLLTHKERAEVLKIRTLPKKSPERAAAFSALVNEGNYKHNISVLKSGSGIFITARRDSTDDKKHKVEDYYPCEFCKGFYVMNLLWHHAKNCKVKNLGSKNDREATDLVEPEETTNFLRNSRTLLYCSLLETDEEELILPVLKRMNDGDVKSIFMRDTIIKKFTAVQVKALGHENIQKNDIHRVSQNARSLSRLVLEAQKQKPMASILGLLAPQNFDLVTRCVSSMSRDSATLPIRMGHLIGHCIMAKSAWAIRICNDDMLKESRDFKQLFDAEWRYIVNAPAIRRQNINSQNKPKVIPETQDLVLLRNYLMKELRETVDQMKQKPTAAGFQWLAKVTMCRLILFNKRRVAEVEDLMVHNFINRPSWTDSEEFQLSLSHMEKELAKRMDMIESVAKSKKNHHAFVLITPEAKESIMLLIESREAVGIPKSNPYIFARLNASTPLSGGASLKEIVHKCPLLKSPEIIITTTLRRYTATVSQILDMTSKEFRLLAKHLGHDVKTHKEYFQLSSATLELSKVSRMLMAVENGKVNEWKDRPMSDISLDELPLAEDEEDVPLDEKLADNQRDIDRPLVHKSADKLQTSMNPTMVIPETSDLGATSADKPTVKRGTKRPWEPEENKQFFEQFAHEIENKEMAPTWKLQKAADTLKSRTVVQIRTRVHNIINDKQKLKH